MRDFLSRVVLWRLARRLPPSSASAALGDLEEDYGRRLALAGRLRAGLWLIREARSLDRAYRRHDRFKPGIAEPKGRFMLGDDVRHAWRRIAGHPARTLPCIALLGLGIGLATAMFSVVDSVMFRPAPFPHPEQLVEVGFSRAEPDVMEAWRATGMFQAVESARTASFQTADSAAGTSSASGRRLARRRASCGVSSSGRGSHSWRSASSPAGSAAGWSGSDWPRFSTASARGTRSSGSAYWGRSP